MQLACSALQLTVSGRDLAVLRLKGVHTEGSDGCVARYALNEDTNTDVCATSTAVDVDA